MAAGGGVERLACKDTVAPEMGAERGLTSAEAAKRLAHYGANTITEEHVGALRKLLSYLWGPVPWMIEAAGLLSLVLRHWADFAIIVVMLLLNASVGFWQEHKADNAIATLKKSLALKARARRDGQWQEVPARELVPGDLVLVELGNIVPADLELVAGDYLSVDESALTGESLPVDKKIGDAVRSGSIAKMGVMQGRVTATGMSTFFGKTARLVQTARTGSHFQRAVLQIGNFLILSTLGLVALILLVALYRGDPWLETLQFALILTVAAIPVALPAVLSVTMAVGAERLARMRAIVSRLVSIEEMAGVDVLCSDKTGTLTRNELTLGEPVLLEAGDADELILAAALASAGEGQDAIDRAVRGGLRDPATLDGFTIGHLAPFDPVRKHTLAEVEQAGRHFRVAKGAPQVILDLTAPDPSLAARVAEQTEALAGKGFRTLGVARTDETGAWNFLGLLPLLDPPRADSAATIERLRTMGVQMKMVTGDHEAIARQIAGQVGLGQNIVAAGAAFGGGDSGRLRAAIDAADGFARVLPEHKIEIVRTLQAEGHIVGMTGDGVNDAPALRQADAGIAVSGATDAARAAADLVLTAPGLSVIASGIEEARRIFERMNGYATYRIAETIRVLLFMTLSILVFEFYPVTAVMIVLLALLNDFPIMMIAYDNVRVASRPVRWRMHRMLAIALVLGVLGVLETFLLLWLAERWMELPSEVIRTLIFLKLLVSGHLTIYLTRNDGPIWRRPFPSWKLFATSEATQVLGTLAAVYGLFVMPVGWGLALLVWAYALAAFVIESGIKIMALRLIDRATSYQSRHIERVGTSLHGA